MYLLVLIGSVLVLGYFLTIAGALLQSKGILPAVLVSTVEALQYAYGLLFSLTTSIIAWTLSLW